MRSLQSKTQNTSRSPRPGLPRVHPEIEHVRALTAQLKANLSLCAEPANSASEEQPPGVDAVHDTRTGTRRIEALLDALSSAAQQDRGARSEAAQSARASVCEAIERWQKLLKKIRRSAGAVRDLDVHRHLLRGLLEEMSASQPAAGSSETASATIAGPLARQAEDLDAWLQHARQDHAQPLVHGAKKWAARLDAHLAALTQALQAQQAARRKPAGAAVTALQAFARLSTEMQQLHAGNLHDFRKGAKKARYMAETGGSDTYAGAVGKALKKLQDEIGGWHDWLVLAGEARRALGGEGAELIARIERERDQHYQSAMKTVERMRGRLMGEWRASTAKPRRPPASKLP